MALLRLEYPQAGIVAANFGALLQDVGYAGMVGCVWDEDDGTMAIHAFDPITGSPLDYTPEEFLGVAETWKPTPPPPTDRAIAKKLLDTLDPEKPDPAVLYQVLRGILGSQSDT